MGQLKEVRTLLSNLFKAKSIDLSDLDWIMVSVLGCTRGELALDRNLTSSEVKQIFKLVRKRLKGIPLSQVLAEVEFYGIKFYVNKHVLSPRPETELLVEEVIKEQSSKIGLDIGTGSGAIAITLTKVGGCEMSAVDISGRALKVAKKNEKKNFVDIKFIKSDLFSKVNGRFDFIVSNPPYIKSEDIRFLDREVREHEPLLALDGGKSGYGFYERIIKEAPNFLKDRGKIYFEIGIGQAEELKSLLEKDFEDIRIKKDYNNIERIVVATKK